MNSERTIFEFIFWAILCGIATYFSIEDAFSKSLWYLILTPFMLFAFLANVFGIIKSLKDE